VRSPKLGAAIRPRYVVGVSSADKITELPGLRVTVDRVVYQPDALTPQDRTHCFVY